MAAESTKQTVQLIPLSPCDNIMPSIYIQFILCIQTEENAESSAVTELLSQGLRKTCEEVPILDGEVVPDTTKADRLGRSAVRLSRPGRLQLQSKDLTKRSNAGGGDDRKWSFPKLAKENWPQRLFHGDIFSPVAALQNPFDEGLPVMVAQSNFIEGGLLLYIAFNHKVVDGTGVGTIVRLWAQNCRELKNCDDNAAKVDSEITQKDKNADIDVEKKLAAAPKSAVVITAEALDRTALMPTGPIHEIEDTRWGQLPEYRVVDLATTQPLAARAAWLKSSPRIDVETFSFTADSLARLKDATKPDLSATDAANADPPVQVGDAFRAHTVPWISTNDALCALLWSSIARARLRQATDDALTLGKQDGEEDPAEVQLECKLGMANNGRKKLDPPLPDAYIGNVTLVSLTVLPISALAPEEALPSVAKAIRASVSLVTNQRIRAIIRLVDSLPDVAALQFTNAPASGVDLDITSWAEMGLNGLDWGHAVGKVERVRMVDWNFNGVCLIYPRAVDGSLEVFVALPTAVMKHLTRDEPFLKFAQVGGGGPHLDQQFPTPPSPRAIPVKD